MFLTSRIIPRSEGGGLRSAAPGPVSGHPSAAPEQPQGPQPVPLSAAGLLRHQSPNIGLLSNVVFLTMRPGPPRQRLCRSPSPRRHLNSWQPLRPLVCAATCAPGGHGWGSRRGRRSPRRTYSIDKGIGRGTRRCRGSPYSPATCSRRPPVTDPPCPSPTWHRPGKFTARRPAVPSLRVTSSRRASPVSMGTRGAGGGSSSCRGPARRHVRGRDGARRRRAVAVAERSERGLRGGERPRAGSGSLLYPRGAPGPRRLWGPRRFLLPTPDSPPP